MSGTSVRTLLGMVVCALALASIAKADALYFEKIQVGTRSEATCLRFAGDVARTQAFQNVHKSQFEVAGVKNGVYLSITCVGRGEMDAIAVVMAVAPNFTNAKQMGEFVAKKVSGIRCIDSPC
jgi:hypothetical protein